LHAKEKRHAEELESTKGTHDTPSNPSHVLSVVDAPVGPVTVPP